jgi:hypothetical protein
MKVRTIPNFNRKVVETKAKSIPLTHIYIALTILAKTIILWKEILNWWSSIPPISTKWTITSHHNSMNFEHKIYHDIWRWKSRSVLGKTHNVLELNQLMGSQPSPLDIYMFYYINYKIMKYVFSCKYNFFLKINFHPFINHTEKITVLLFGA